MVTDHTLLSQEKGSGPFQYADSLEYVSGSNQPVMLTVEDNLSQDSSVPTTSPSESQDQWLKDLFLKYETVITDFIGCTPLLKHCIDNKNAKLVRKSP